jgi:hypothetical protein
MDSKLKAKTIKNEFKDEQKGKTLNKSELGILKQLKVSNEVKLMDEMQKKLESKKMKIRTRYKKDE